MSVFDKNIHGPDVSSYQGNVNWPAVKSGGATFAFCKATEGTSYNDPTFTRNWSGIKAAGLKRGVYHFARPDHNTAQAEAQHFMNVVQSVEHDDLVVLDFEQAASLSPADMATWADTWLAIVQQHFGVVPILYTYASYIHGGPLNGACGKLTKYPLWIAAYGTEPTVAPWSQWTFWQYTDKGSVPGIGSCDNSYGRLDAVPVSSGGTTVSSFEVPNARGVIARPDGTYWEFATDGGVFAPTGVPFYGSAAGKSATPVTGGCSTKSGNGYYLVAEDGGVFAFGDAAFHGSYPGLPDSAKQGTRKFVGIVLHPDGNGYTLVSDVFDGSGNESYSFSG